MFVSWAKYNAYSCFLFDIDYQALPKFAVRLRDLRINLYSVNCI